MNTDPLRWLRANGNDTAPLTGQDARALLAIAACWELYAVGDKDGQLSALDAVRHLLHAMQPKCWPLARELIARSLDWSDRDRVWAKLGAPDNEEPWLSYCEARQ